MPEHQTNNEQLAFQEFFKTIQRLEEIYDYQASDAKILEYHRVLVGWGVTNENISANFRHSLHSGQQK